MRGYIQKRGNSWRIGISMGLDHETRKYKYSYTTVNGTRKDADKRLRELLTEKDNGTFIHPGRTTLAEYLRRWINDYVAPNLAPRTVEGYADIINRHVIPNLGNIALSQLKPEHIQRYYSETLAHGSLKHDGTGLSASTVRHHHMCLHNALATAVKWNLLVRNAADQVTPPRAQRPEMHTWQEDDVRRFLDAAKDTHYYALFFLLLSTGMRRSELLALRWCDLDLLLGQIHVNRTLHCLRDNTIVYRQPKTVHGRRPIALPPSAIAVLREHKTKQSEMADALGAPLTDESLAFSLFDGRPRLPNSVTHAWIKLVRRTGLKYIRLHDARHTHASLMLKQGVHPKIVQERLGHASIAITLDLYSHVAPGLQEAAAKTFDIILAPRVKQIT